jgi:hypothetical protein
MWLLRGPFPNIFHPPKAAWIEPMEAKVGLKALLSRKLALWYVPNRICLVAGMYFFGWAARYLWFHWAQRFKSVSPHPYVKSGHYLPSGNVLTWPRAGLYQFQEVFREFIVRIALFSWNDGDFGFEYSASKGLWATAWLKARLPFLSMREMDVADSGLGDVNLFVGTDKPGTVGFYWAHDCPPVVWALMT